MKQVPKCHLIAHISILLETGLSCAANKIIISKMDYRELIVRENRILRKQISEFESGTERITRVAESSHRFSEPKGRPNLIKINKSKLPNDFFQKREQPTRHTPSVRLNLPLDNSEPTHAYKKAESERLHYSPEKTSFFGYFEEQQPVSAGRASGGKLYNRKFQTRDEPKRDAFPIDSSRKLTTATKNCKNEFLELFPSTHDEQLTEIIISSSKTRNFKLSPRKEYTSKVREQQPMIDPQKFTLDRREEDCILKQRPGQKWYNNNLSPQLESQSLNVTFFNAKSSCLPPISRIDRR